MPQKTSETRCQSQVLTPPISTLRLKKELKDEKDPSKLSFRPIRPTHDDDEFDRPRVPSFQRKSRFGNFPVDGDQTEELRGLDFVGDHDNNDDDDDIDGASMTSFSMD